MYKEIQPRFPSDHSLDPVAATCLPKVQGLRAEVGGGGNYWTVGANVEQLGILAKSGAQGNIVKSYLELSFIRENTYKKAAVNVTETI